MIKHITNDISRDFKFCLGGEWKAEAAELVCLPHTVEITPANSSGCRNYQGKCIYEKTLFIPSEYEGKKVWIEFEGAMGVSELFIGGEKVAEHLSGYIPFVCDVGAFLKYGEENVLRITLDNSDNGDVPPGKPQRDLDFTYDGGLYRRASISVSEPLYITNPLLENEVAGGGIFVHYSNVSEQSATVHTKIEVKNEYADEKSFSLVTCLVDADGRCVYEHSEAISLASGKKNEH